MSYLQLIKNDLQKYIDTVGSILHIDVAIADDNLTRILGTENFKESIDKVCSRDSIFAKVIKTGQPIINLDDGLECRDCSQKGLCDETANMSYPINSEGKTIGVISFASFNPNQKTNIKIRESNYFEMLKETAYMVESQVNNAKNKNRIGKSFIEVNDIINTIHKGIIIIGPDKRIYNINNEAISILNIDFSKDKVIGEYLEKFITGIELEYTLGKEIVGLWDINNVKSRVIYSINKMELDDGKQNIMISFDTMNYMENLVRIHKEKEPPVFENIIGESESILRAINKSKIAARTNSTILLYGASGTGKELFARSIHSESSRRNKDFVAINCGSIPENLIESELFGYEDGAFTGASRGGRIGKIEQANKGTLFLDEIGDLPLYSQSRLLRVLQEKEIEPVGSTKPRKVDIRVISATNKDLLTLVKEGKFRLDLYYRLNVIPIELPDLNTRDKDVLLISKYFIKKMSKEMDIKEKKLSKEVEDVFVNSNWLGNIRELENVLEYALCFSTTDQINLDDLPDYFLSKEKIEDNKSDFSCFFEHMLEKELSLEEMNNILDRKIIESLLDKYGNTTESKKLISEKLGIGLATLYRKMK